MYSIHIWQLTGGWPILQRKLPMFILTNIGIQWQIYSLLANVQYNFETANKKSYFNNTKMYSIHLQAGGQF